MNSLHRAATSVVSPAHQDVLSIFASLPPAYFTPSSPAHLTYLFLLHGGHILPPLHPSRSTSDPASTQPLSLPVEYYFVIPNDPLIPHLSQRPIVLFNAGWVGECVRRGERVSLGDWIVEGDSHGEVVYSTPDSNQARGAINSTQMSSEGSLPGIQTPLTPTQAVSSRPRIVAPRLLLDFDRNTTLDLFSGETSDFLHTLRNHDCYAAPSRSNKRKAAYQQCSSETPRPFRPDPISSPLDQGIRSFPAPPMSTRCHTTTPDRTLTPRPPRYVLEEVMVLLKKANRAMVEVEVVGGPSWKVDKVRHEPTDSRQAY